MLDHQNVLHVRVNESLILDAGKVEEIVADDGTPKRIIHAPRRTMFDQLVDYLEGPAAAQMKRGARTWVQVEARAAMALCIRWGSYFAVLADNNKPAAPIAHDENISLINNSEMYRINVEATAALGSLIDMMRDDYFGRYQNLVTQALQLPLPMQGRKAGEIDQDWLIVRDAMALSSDPDNEYTQGLLAQDYPWYIKQREAVQQHPARALANSMILNIWRNNGMIESVHAGSLAFLPLTQRRILPQTERFLNTVARDRFRDALYTIYGMTTERTESKWAEKVLPFCLHPLFAPSDWSLTEKTRDVTLSGHEKSITTP